MQSVRLQMQLDPVIWMTQMPGTAQTREVPIQEVLALMLEEAVVLEEAVTVGQWGQAEAGEGVESSHCTSWSEAQDTPFAIQKDMTSN